MKELPHCKGCNIIMDDTCGNCKAKLCEKSKNM